MLMLGRGELELKLLMLTVNAASSSGKLRRALGGSNSAGGVTSQKAASSRLASSSLWNAVCQHPKQTKDSQSARLFPLSNTTPTVAGFFHFNFTTLPQSWQTTRTTTSSLLSLWTSPAPRHQMYVEASILADSLFQTNKDISRHDSTSLRTDGICLELLRSILLRWRREQLELRMMKRTRLPKNHTQAPELWTADLHHNLSLQSVPAQALLRQRRRVESLHWVH